MYEDSAEGLWLIIGTGEAVGSNDIDGMIEEGGGLLMSANSWSSVTVGVLVEADGAYYMDRTKFVGDKEQLLLSSLTFNGAWLAFAFGWIVSSMPTFTVPLKLCFSWLWHTKSYGTRTIGHMQGIGSWHILSLSYRSVKHSWNIPAL
jgi:hypothetical protein